MSLKNKTSQKFISALIIISILIPAVLFSKPEQANASGWPVVDITHNITSVFNGVTQTGTLATSAVNTGLHIKDIVLEVLKEVARTFAKRLLQEMTKSTVSWINSGFHGSPLFLQNPESFFKDIAKSEIKTLVNLFGYDPNRFPFGKNFALNIINSYQRTLEQNAQYSLSAVINDPALLNNYRNNFNAGGWNGFLINTQYPQNNYLGFQMLATEQLARQLQGTTQNAAQKVQTTLNQGMGFLSPKTCPSNPNYNNGTNEFLKPSFNQAEYDKNHPYNPPNKYIVDDKGFIISKNPNYDTYESNWNYNLETAKAAWNDPKGPNVCPGGLVATTPGSVVGNQIMTAMSSSFRKTELGAAVGGSISAILDSLLNKFFDKVTGGLTGSGTKNFDDTTSSTDTSPGTCSVGGTNNIPMPNLKTKGDCVSLGGTWTLTTSTTTPPPIGTCTLAGGGISETTEADCGAIEGRWTTTPPSTDLGACTVSGETTNTTQNACDLVNGTWNPTPLPPPLESGTCATINGTPLLIATQTECNTAGGIWTPPVMPTNSEPGITPPAPPSGTCSLSESQPLLNITTQADCLAVYATWTPNQ